MKKYFTLILLLSSGLVSKAQFLQPVNYNTRVQLELGNYMSAQSERGMNFSSAVVNTVGLGIEQQLRNRFGARFAFQMWYTVGSYNSLGYDDFRNNISPEVTDRGQYFMADIAATYKMRRNNHETYLIGGGTLALGTDIYRNGYADGFEGNCFSNREYKTAIHPGCILELGYNYTGKRINIGPSFSGRHYPGQYSQYTIKLNIGYNFRIK